MLTFTALIKYPHKRKEAIRFIKFSIVGAFGAIVDFPVFNALILVADWTTDTQLILANIISVSIAILSNFTWNRLWTFPESQTRRKRVQLIQFAVVNLIGLALNTIIFSLVSKFIFNPFMPIAIAANLAKAVAIGLVLFWNFGANRLWTYRGL